jgi:cyclopropane fatty-acyl-phospholipid synthase-like methyltransferase
MLSKIGRFIESWRQERNWERRWAGKRSTNPGWLQKGPRPQVREAVESGWIIPGSSVLDIGCGNGNSSIWLANNGFRVTGLDIAPAAIKRALKDAADIKNAQFMVADATRKLPLKETFDVLLDLGTLHQLKPVQWDAYGKMVRQASHRGTRMLLLMRVWKGTLEQNAETKAERVQALLGKDFIVESAEETDLGVGDSLGKHPGVQLKVLRLS